MTAAPSTVCPCCGHRALGAGIPHVCGVCAWDDHHHEGGWIGAPRTGLVEAQRTYARIGVADPALAPRARPPRAAEARPAWWLSLDAAPEAIAREVERAFAVVELDGAPPWQLLAREDLAGITAFDDARALRYHTPAYLVLGLRAATLVPGTESLLRALASDAVQRLVTEPERRAVARFLAHLAVRDSPDGHDALRALRHGWGAALDPDQLAMILGHAPLN